jgi:phage I-like protein
VGMFTYITDLPPHVRGVLDVGLQQLWLDTFIQVEMTTGNLTEAYNTAWVKAIQTAFPGQIVAGANQPQVAPPEVSTADLMGAGAAFSESPVGYWVDLKSYKFDDVAEGDVSWIQAFPHGTYYHAVYGKIEMNPQRAAQMAQNVKLNVRGQDLDIDYDHKEKTGEAAGWVRDAEARADGLWLAVSWTKSALQKLKDRAYRYFSPEFVDKWVHPQTKQEHRDVLFGGALTNRPFLKGILPINLAEVIKGNEGGNLVDRATMEKLAKRLGIQFDEKTSDEDLAKALSDVEEEAPKDKETEEETDEEKAKREAEEAAAQEALLSEATLKKLAESNPSVKALMEARDADSKRIGALEAANRLSETNVKLSELQAKAKEKGFAIPPATLSEARDLMAGLPTKLSENVYNMLAGLVDKGMVELGERGKSKPGKTTNATKKFNDAVEQLMKDEKMSYAEAATQLSETDEDLFNAYLEEQAEGVQL